MARRGQVDVKAMKEQIKTLQGGFEADKRMWKPTLDGQLEKSFIIRFLPSSDGTPFTKYYEHSFDYFPPNNNTTKKKYWKNCINTFGYDRECPICEKNRELYNSPYDKDKDLGKERARKLNYVSNIFIVKDDDHKENEGKVFLYKFGKSIYDKINQKMNPSDEDRKDPEFKEFYPYELYDTNEDGSPNEDCAGNFYLKIKEKGKFANGNQIPNYEDSKFLSPCAFLKNDEDAIGAVLDACHALEEFTAEDKFPDNDSVIKLVGHLLGIDAEGDDPTDDEPQAGNLFDDGDDIPDFPTPSVPQESAPSTPQEEPVVVEENPAPITVDKKKASAPPSPSDDDDEAFFNQVKKGGKK